MAAQIGIQQLLNAEQQAQARVARARKEKVALLKRARDEAADDVAKARREKQAEFEAQIKSGTTESDDYQQQLAGETEKEIREINVAAKAKSNDVVELLLKNVAEVAYE